MRKRRRHLSLKIRIKRKIVQNLNQKKKVMKKNIVKIKTQTIKIVQLLRIILVNQVTAIKVVKQMHKTSNNGNSTAANTSNKEDKKEVTEANGGAAAPGTFNNYDAAKSYANEEINRLAKANKKNYSYTLDRNSKGEVVVKITEG